MNSEALKEGFSMLRSVAEFLVDHFNGKRHDFLKQKRIFEAVRRDLCDVLDKLYKAENEALTDDDEDIICLGEGEDGRLPNVNDQSNEKEQGEDIRVVQKRCLDDDVVSCPGAVKRQCREDLSQVK